MVEQVGKFVNKIDICITCSPTSDHHFKAEIVCIVIEISSVSLPKFHENSPAPFYRITAIEGLAEN